MLEVNNIFWFMQRTR